MKAFDSILPVTVCITSVADLGQQLENDSVRIITSGRSVEEEDKDRFIDASEEIIDICATLDNIIASSMTEKDGRTEKEREEDGLSVHSGMSETSRILFLRPDLVGPAVKDAPPLTGRNWDDLTRIAREKDWPGYFGSPRLASAAFGARVWGRYSATVVELAAKILDGFDYRQLPRHADALKGVAAHDAFAKAALEHEQQIKRRQLDWLKKKGLE